MAWLDTDPPGKAVLGENVYYRAKDGSKVLLDPVVLLNATPVDLASTTATPTTTADALAKSASAEKQLRAPTGQGSEKAASGSSSIVNTDGVPEGVVNKYFTRARGVSALTTYFA